jgi:hypothetical protein
MQGRALLSRAGQERRGPSIPWRGRQAKEGEEGKERICRIYRIDRIYRIRNVDA